MSKQVDIAACADYCLPTAYPQSCSHSEDDDMSDAGPESPVRPQVLSFALAQSQSHCTVPVPWHSCNQTQFTSQQRVDLMQTLSIGQVGRPACHAHKKMRRTRQTDNKVQTPHTSPTARHLATGVYRSDAGYTGVVHG